MILPLAFFPISEKRTGPLIMVRERVLKGGERGNGFLMPRKLERNETLKSHPFEHVGSFNEVRVLGGLDQGKIGEPSNGTHLFNI